MRCSVQSLAALSVILSRVASQFLNAVGADRAIGYADRARVSNVALHQRAAKAAAAISSAEVEAKCSCSALTISLSAIRRGALLAKAGEPLGRIFCHTR